MIVSLYILGLVWKYLCIYVFLSLISGQIKIKWNPSSIALVLK